MRSKTSSFNRTIFIKTMARFWPLWAAYFIVWFLCMPFSAGAFLQYNDIRWDIFYLQENIFMFAKLGGTVIGMITAVLAAMAVWSFLYTARSASGMASLPVSRESVFFSVTLAGIAPVLAANVLIALCTLVVELAYGQVDAVTVMQWLAVVSLIYIFFYGFAVFCAQLTGNILVLPAVYAVLNVTVDAVWEMVNALCGIFLYGIYGDIRLGNPAKILSPPIKLWMADVIRPIDAWDAERETMRTVGYELHGWGMFAAYAAAGLVFAALALWLYKKRRMETAGDVVAVEVLKPVFKYCMTFGCGLVLGLLLYSITGYRSDVGMKGALIVLLYMLIGAFLGWVSAKMLIHKSFRVWKGSWLGLIICCAVLAVFMVGMEADIVGYETHIPDPADVESVSVGGNGDYMTISDPVNIASVTGLHRAIVEHKGRYESMQETLRHDGWTEDYDEVYMTVTYALRSGGYISRRYDLGYNLTQPETQDDVLSLQAIANTDEGVRSRKETPIPVNADTVYYGYAESTVFRVEIPSTDYEKKGLDPEADWQTVTWEFTPSELAELYKTCIVPDIEDGTLGRVWFITDEEYEKTVCNTRIYIELREPLERYGHGAVEQAVGEYSYATFYTVPTTGSWRTNAWLEKHGVTLHTIAEVNEFVESAPEYLNEHGPVRIPAGSPSDILLTNGVG